MPEKRPKITTKEFVSTGQAAELCSVTPDTVLKWIKAGKIQAARTAGGHYRIPREILQTLIESGTLTPLPELLPRKFQFCWEYYEKNGDFCEKCRECIVYRSRAKRCYEIGKIPADTGHAHVFCQRTCDDCEFYRVVKGQRLNLLVITDQAELSEKLENQAGKTEFNLRLVDNEYQCSMVIESFRPDYVVIDNSLGKTRCRSFVKHLTEDPRVPYVKIILAGKIDDMPAECNKMIFAVINKPFSIEELESLMDLAQQDT